MPKRLALVGFAVLAACSRRESPRGSGPATGTEARARAPAVESAGHVPEAPSASATARAPVARGSIGLVLQRVDAVCGLPPPGHPGRFYVGTDVLIEEHDAEHPGGKRAARGFAFCPTRAPDGGAVKPLLNTWRICRAYPSCQVVSSDGGPQSERAEVRCGKVRVILEVTGGQTVLRGPFGERVLAPYPMRVEPIKRQKRDAAVDC